MWDTKEYMSVNLNTFYNFYKFISLAANKKGVKKERSNQSAEVCQSW